MSPSPVRSAWRVRAVTPLLVAMLTLTALVGPAAGPASATERGEMLDLVNADRIDAGRDALELSRRLSRLAMKNSRRMAAARELVHSTRLRAGMTENVGTGPTLRAIQDAFMRSAPHRRALLDRGASRVGVGVVRQGGTRWVTLIFV